MSDTAGVPLIIADGDTPSAQMAAGELRGAFGDVEMRPAQHLFGADVGGRPLLVVRLCHPEFAWLPAYLAARGQHYAYLIDDNFWALDDEVDPRQSCHYAHPAVRATLASFLTQAKSVIVWSARMRDALLARFPGLDVRFVRPGIDLGLWQRAPAASPASPDGVVRIGYPTTRRPSVSALIAEVVGGIGARYGERVRFEFVGWMPEALELSPNVSLTPHIDGYERYAAYVSSRRWDIGLAPIAGSRFDSFKTDIKYREYGAMRTPAVYGAGPPYDDAIVDGVNGVLAAPRADAWITALSSLIDDPGRRARIAAAAYDDVTRTRGLATTGARHAEALAT
ncbi:MAG TPA: glycosyltransferase [Casimicrobiaceae bacterium]|jgi:glycosyltransferase involved in cell wall biosynthesis